MQPWAFDALTVSTTATLIEIIGFVASIISRKSFLSATLAFHGGGVPGGTGTGAITHTEPTGIVSILIPPSTPATDMRMITMTRVMSRSAMVTNIDVKIGSEKVRSITRQNTKMTVSG